MKYWPPGGSGGVALGGAGGLAGDAATVGWELCRATPSCLRLFWQLMRAAASRTFWTAGNSRPIRMAMMAITTSNSIKVKAGRRRMMDPREEFVPGSPGKRSAGYQDICPGVIVLSG